jgi:hypothetical protein
MRYILMFITGLFLGQGVATAQARDVDFGVSVSDGRLQSFYLAVGEHYGVPVPQVVQVREHRGCADEELPVVYFLAARAHVAPAAIIDLRIGKMSWLDIAFHYHLKPDIFFVPVSVEPIGPPYGHAYGYYRKYGPAGDWKKVSLTDREVVDLVNLRFLSEHHRMAPETVMAMRGRESGFIVINDKIKKEKDKGKPAQHQQNQNQNQNGKGKDKKR